MHHKGVILWEWVDGREKGALSSENLQAAQQAKLDERLDRIEELESLSHDEAKAYIFPFRGALKKLKIRGNVALRPILVCGPVDTEHEVTFLLVTTERDGKLMPSNAEVQAKAKSRLNDIQVDGQRRQRYERF